LLAGFGGDPDTIKKWLVFDLEVATRIVAAHAEGTKKQEPGGRPLPGAKPSEEEAAMVAMMDKMFERRKNGTQS